MPRAFGAHATTMKDHMYVLPGGKHIFTSPWAQLAPTRHCSASISISVGDPFDVVIDGTTYRQGAAAVKPMVERRFASGSGGFVAFQFDPSHRLYPRFRKIALSGILPLDRALFDPLNEQLRAALHGTLQIEEAEVLFEQAVMTALPHFPRVPPIDRRVAKAIDLLWQNCNWPLQELAAAVGLSYHRLSHVFTENMGISLRSYQQWRKIRRAISLSKHGLSLAELAEASGFADAAHFSRAFVQLHGAPPSYFLQNDNFKVIAHRSEPGAIAKPARPAELYSWPLQIDNAQSGGDTTTPRALTDCSDRTRGAPIE